MATTEDSPKMEKAVLALLAVTLADRAERLRLQPSSQAQNNETVLTQAGFSPREIADLTGRNYEAIKSAVRRSPAKKSPSNTGKTKPAS